MANRKKDKGLLVYLRPEDHQTIKVRAAQMNMSMGQYIMEAIAERFAQENKLGWK